MKKKCAKCKDDLAGGGVFVESGESFSFCKTCSDLLEKAPTGNTIHDFLGHKKYESWVARNIREARERREKGESPWPNPKLIADEKT